MIAIGIDPGVTTGIAVWDAERFKFIEIMSSGIIAAMDTITDHRETFSDIFVIVEDARKRGVFTIADRQQEKFGAGVREGVGSIKRDSSIWEEFLTDHGIPFELRTPRSTKLDAERFKQLTGWEQQTNKHSRDAGMIVFQLNRTMMRLKLDTYKTKKGGAQSDEQALHPRSDPVARVRGGKRTIATIRFNRRRR